ncbi:MAG: hypothetical protein ABJA64_00130 [Candidatus Saccharibacteria bacterium]
MATQDIALRKRQQIAKANRMMFVWVACVSAVVGVAAVASVFLFQKMIFNEKVLAEKQKTASILRDNNAAVDGLKANVRVLNTNQALLDSRAQTDDKPLQVILDALPADANSSALGASLQEVLLKSDGVTIESLTVNPVAGVEASQDSASSGDVSSGTNTIDFSFTVSAGANQANALRDLLRRLESSIRAIDVQSLTVEMQGSKILLTAQAQAFYEPAITAGLKDKVVRP